MSKLQTLRRQLGALRFWRKLVRWVIGYSAMVTVVLWTLVGIFVVDLFFFKMLSTALDVSQRTVVLAIALGCFGIAAHYLMRPFLGVQESTTEMALLVEQQNDIESDLVAALQFEGAEASRWGSRQLEESVIDYVAQFAPGLDTFKGFDSTQLWRRVIACVVTILLLCGLCVGFPGYASAFFNRLAFGDQHYPTRVTIDEVVINHTDVFQRDRDGTVPRPVNAAQGQPLTFDVRAFGRDDEKHSITLTSTNAGSQSRTVVELSKLTADDRLERLQLAAKMIEKAREQNDFMISGPWQAEVISLVRFDAASAIALLKGNDETEPNPKSAEKVVTESIQSWDESKLSGSVYTGQLERMIDPVQYTVNIGDAWTESALVSMTPLPIVEPYLKVEPPDYAKAGWQSPLDPTARQLSVLEGSKVEVAIECTNKKSLASAWVIVKIGESSQRFELKKTDASGTKWSLPLAKTPFVSVTKEVRFEIQVTDTDGLQLLNSIHGYIRLKMDRGPTGSADVVRNVFLPKATPTIDFMVHDDYGVSQILLHLALEKDDNDGSQAADVYDQSPTEASKADIELETLTVHNGSSPLLANKLPYKGKYKLNLSSLQQQVADDTAQPVVLEKGNRLKVTLEVVDYRGDATGTAYKAEPLFLEIADVSDVFAANAKDDERADKAFEDIKNKILE